MAGGNVTVSLPQMIDIALNFPECGSVNFNMLHSLLHVVVQQLELVQCQVEFRGKDGERVQDLLKVTARDSLIKITEYVVSPAKDAGKVVERKPPKRIAQSPDWEENAASSDKAGSHESVQTVIVVEQAVQGGETYEPCVISKKYLDDMRAEVTDLRKKLQELAELPGNVALIDALRGAGIEKATPVLDMFQTMTLNKKMEAAETGMEKLASMVEDLAKQSGLQGYQGEGGETTTVAEALNNIQDRLNNIESFIDSGAVPGEGAGGGGGGGHGIKRPPSGRPGEPDASGSDGTGAGSGSSEKGKEGSVTPGTGPGSPVAPGSPVSPGGGRTPGGSIGSQYVVDLNVPDFTNMTQEEFAIAIRKELKKIKLEIKLIYDKLGMLFHLSEEFTHEEIWDAIKTVVKKHKANKAVGGGADTSELPPGERLEQLEDRFNGTTEQIASLDSSMNHEINNLHSQFAEMEKAFGNIMEKIHFGLPGGDSPGAGETLGELYDKLMGLQSDMENLAETASKLVEDKEDKQRLLEVLTEQIEFLKTVKADKEDLEDALADKADACAINRKVSHDQFDTACDELSRGIEEALGKLTQQEELWQQALDEIQKEIGNKLDRMELGPLRDFVNNKLKMLQQRLKALTALKKEAEAAGTKKFLRNVNCISCDKDVVMRKEMDPSLLPQPYAMPPSRSMGPYLAYELDALRKQQKSLPNSRNLNHFENALHQKSPRTGEDHICNRYCGGSHTITTPQQRVTRLGHFLNQWGPEAQGVTEIIKDKDEKLECVGHTTGVVEQRPGEMSPRVSKIASTEIRKERKSSAGHEKKLSNAGEVKPTKPPSVQKVGSAVAQKPSGEIVEKPRRSSSGSVQKGSQSSVKRSSQPPSKGSVHQEEKSGPRVSEQIPEETPSEVEKENAEGTGEGGDKPPSKRGSQATPRHSASPVVSPEDAKESPEAGPPSGSPSASAGEGAQRQSVASKRSSQVGSKQSGSAKQSPSPSPKGSAQLAPKGSGLGSHRASIEAPAEPPAETPAEPPAPAKEE